MTLLRHHIVAIVSFLLGFVILALACVVVLVYLHPPHTVFLLVLMLAFPMSFLVPLGIIVPALYWRADARRKAEWAVLAPTLMAGTVLAADWNNVMMLFNSTPPGPAPDSYFVLQGLVNFIFSIGFGILCAVLVARYMSRAQPLRPRSGIGREFAVVLALSLAVSIGGAVTMATADAFAWGIGSTWEEAGQTAYLRTALDGGIRLFSIVATWIILAYALWRRSDQLSRWSAMAAIGSWVALYAWLSMIRTFEPWTEQLGFLYQFNLIDNWQIRESLKDFMCGIVAGGLAVLYARVVVMPLGRRALDSVNPLQEANRLSSGG